MKTWMCAGVLSVAAGAFAATVPSKPDVLVILADDLARNELGCYGGRNVPTPNIDRLAGEGLRFTRVFASEAMCSPTRASLYTGLYPVRNGTYRNHGDSRPGTKSVVHHLRPLGYRVGLAGKVDVRPKDVFPFEIVPGFEPNCVAERADYTLDGIREFMTRDDSAPYCLFVCSTLPHIPWTVGDASHFPPDRLVLPPTWIDTPETRAAFSAYCAEVEALDRQVGDVLALLEKTGRRDRTVVFFCGEQGAQFPGAKWTLFEPGVSSGLIARWPGVIRPGGQTDAIVQYEDMLPTLIELAGGTPPGDLDGISFNGVLTGRAAGVRQWAYGVHNNVPEGHPYPVRSICTGKYRLILNLLPDAEYSEKHMMDMNHGGYWASWVRAASADPKAARLAGRFLHRPGTEMYDLEKDPWELENLASHSEHESTVRDLESKLRSWMIGQGDPGAALDLEPPPPSRPAGTRPAGTEKR